MQDHSLIRLGKPQDAADLLSGPAFHIAERDDEALGGWQVVDGVADDADRLRGDKPILDAAFPRERWVLPVLGPLRMERVEEALGCDCGFRPVGLVRRELRVGDAAPLPLPVGGPRRCSPFSDRSHQRVIGRFFHDSDPQCSRAGKSRHLTARTVRGKE